MAVNMVAVRSAMAEILSNAWGQQVQVATAPDQLTPPCLLIMMPELVYNLAGHRALDRAVVPLYGIHPRTHDQAAVDMCDIWISGDGPQSIRALLEEDQSLGGACQTLVVKDCRPELWPSATGDLPCYHWTIEVYG